MNKVQLAAGTTRGFDHFLSGRNNQDAFNIEHRGEYSFAVVCDGCGSGKFSEVGSLLGARMITANALGIFPHYQNDFLSGLKCLKDDLIWDLNNVVNMYGERKGEIVNDYFLFTIVACFFTPLKAYFFSFGDGMYAINGHHTEIGPFENNAPPYFAYNIVPTSLKYSFEGALDFQLNAVVGLDELETFMIGTDGVQDLIDAQDKKICGHLNSIGGIDQFWNDPKYLRNQLNISRRLTSINGGIPRSFHIGEKEFVTGTKEGYLKDDTTLVVGRVNSDD